MASLWTYQLELLFDYYSVINVQTIKINKLECLEMLHVTLTLNSNLVVL